MLKHLLCVLAVLSLSACNYDPPVAEPGGEPPPRPIPEVKYDTSLVGDWKGTIITKVQDRRDDSREVVVRVRGDENAITISDLCPSGEGSVTLTKGGDNLTWDHYYCPDFLNPFSAARLNFSYGKLETVNGNPVINMEGFWEEPAAAQRSTSLRFVATQRL